MSFRGLSARNAWDGVFTAGQAARGKALFEAKCAIGYGAELNSAEMTPPLAGDEAALGQIAITAEKPAGK
jgi:hypothetical protein